VTVKGENGRRYEVLSELYGTRNMVHRLYYGGIFLASTDQKGPAGESSSSMEVAVRKADEMVKTLGIEVA